MDILARDFFDAERRVHGDSVHPIEFEAAVYEICELRQGSMKLNRKRGHGSYLS